MKPIFKRLPPAAARRMALASAVFVATMADAFASGAGGLPWDGAISTLQNDLTGPVATGISVIAFLAAGASLVFGEELGGIAKKALYVVLGVAFIVLGNKFLAVLGLTGAMVA
ncbi:Conjugal transfer protein TrbC [Thiomonas sp. X19]|uniref:TrbC/VirB2 family protein n=1 Tax=Thiomonas sp. X19 TaxID=1050370 RepID=UPI000B728A55|nr:TrbC/VirB2 family protein [Thiomonas sp. X19]SCC95813.1 Conjugal transfer protein TrbC [Thiomonas sp. X19]